MKTVDGGHCLFCEHFNILTSRCAKHPELTPIDIRDNVRECEFYERICEFDE